MRHIRGISKAKREEQPYDEYMVSQKKSRYLKTTSKPFLQRKFCEPCWNDDWSVCKTCKAYFDASKEQFRPPTEFCTELDFKEDDDA